MFSLVIDTCTERGCAAFYDGNQVLFQGQFPFGLNNSKYLLPEIDRGFKTLGKSVDDLDYVAVGVGPGSYTGIRVGVITAKTIAFAAQKPLVTFCSLEAFQPTQEGSFAAILDAKIGGAYVLKRKENSPRIMPLNDLAQYLQDVRILVTPNAAVIKKKIDDLYQKNSWIWEEVDPNALHLCQLSAQRFAERDVTDSRQVELLYLRKTQAEIEKEARR
jgi:tRNA threonylcarbamoyladenosine biosynthesis protein TsaB